MIELRVNESALLQRVETRVAEMRARGEEVRIDDTPEVLTKRLASYRSLTEPLIHYYSERRKLLTVDGMMTIEHVTREINRILAAIGAVEAKAPKKAAQGSGRKGAKAAAKKAAKSAQKAARKSAKKTAKALERPETGLQRRRKSRPGRLRRVPRPAPPERPGKAPKRSRKSELKHRDG